MRSIGQVGLMVGLAIAAVGTFAFADDPLAKPDRQPALVPPAELFAPQIRLRQLSMTRGAGAAKLELPEGEAKQRMRVVKRTPAGQVTLESPEKLFGKNAPLPVQRDELTIVRSDVGAGDKPAPTKTQTVGPGNNIVAFPAVGYTIADVAGAGPARAPEAREYRLMAIASGEPTWVKERGVYEVTFRLGLLDKTGGASAVNLREPITIQLSSNHGRMDPEVMQIKELGVRGFVQTRMSWGPRVVDPMFKAHSDFGEIAVAVAFARGLGGLALRVERERLRGWGLGTTKVMVVRQSPDGQDLQQKQPLQVALSIGRGVLGTALLTIPANAALAATDLRSDGLGEQAVQASADGFETTRKVQFDPPFDFGILAIVGGVLGGCVHLLSAQHKKKSASTLHLIVEGLLGGLAIVVGVMVKTSFPGFPLDIRDTQAGAFLLAFFGGVGGVPFLHALAGKMGMVAKVVESRSAAI